MIARLNEALAALQRVIVHDIESSKDMIVVREALESAKREAEDRAAIREWLAHQPSDDVQGRSVLLTVERGSDGELMDCLALSLGKNDERLSVSVPYDDHAQGLRVAANWCRGVPREVQP